MKRHRNLWSPAKKRPRINPVITYNKSTPSAASAGSATSAASAASAHKPSLAGAAGIPVAANVKVAVRVRPPNERERNALGNATGQGIKPGSCVRMAVRPVDNQMLLFDPKDDDEPFFYMGIKQTIYNHMKKLNKEMQFVFDRVFGEEATNEEVFQECTEQLVSSLMEGYNCSVFAYGATGAGKTHTMLGNSSHPGVVYLTVNELFNRLAKHSAEKNFDICVSYLEIYNETVHDLLNPSGPLNLRDDGKYGVVVAGLYNQNITTAQELIDMLEKGNKNRTQHPTDANAESSRSHAVFQVYVKMRTKTTSQVKIVKLSMIDLAGSERASATGCKGERFKEGANINRSLLALGNCINQLADGAKFIPYRDSKLTRLLKDSLGGNCCTVMIANIAPTSLSYEDTYNTLKYATRANKIQLKIKKNIISCDNHISQYIKQNNELTLRVKQLEEELAKSKENMSPTEKKPDRVPANDEFIKQWRLKNKSLLEQHCNFISNIVKKQAKQRNLTAQALRKHRAGLIISELCSDAIDEELHEDFQKEILKLNSSSNALLEQAKQLRDEIEIAKKEYEGSKQTINSIIGKDIEANPELNLILKEIYNKKHSITSETTIKYLNDLFAMQHSELHDLHKFVKSSLTMLKKCFFSLKGHGKATNSMINSYSRLMRLARNSKVVTWEDSTDNEADNAYINYVSKVDTSFETLPEIPDFNLLANDLQSDLFSESYFASLNAPNLPDETIVLFNEELNSTHTITTSPNANSMYHDQNIVSDIHHDTKPINPNDLNSTFVLAAKTENEPKKPCLSKVDAKKVLTETTNLQRDDNKIQFKGKLATGKHILFKKPITPSFENKGFGSSSNRFQKPKSENIQVGCKTMRVKERNALATANAPYMKPLRR